MGRTRRISHRTLHLTTAPIAAGATRLTPSSFRLRGIILELGRQCWIKANKGDYCGF